MSLNKHPRHSFGSPKESHALGVMANKGKTDSTSLKPSLKVIHSYTISLPKQTKKQMYLFLKKNNIIQNIYNFSSIMKNNQSKITSHAKKWTRYLKGKNLDI